MKVLGLGIDICKHARIQKILDNQKIKVRFLAKVLHPDEYQYKITTEFVASRWAVKEAVIKSVARRRVRFTDVHVAKNPWGEPYLVISGETSQKVQALGIQSHLVSLAHEEDYSAAVCIVMG